MAAGDGRDDYEISVGWDLEGLDAGIDAIQEALTELNTIVNGAVLGDPQRFAAQGRALGRALLAGFQAELRGAGDIATVLQQQLSLDPARFNREAEQYVA